MAKNDDTIEMEGEITEVLPGTKFRVRLLSNDVLVLGHLSGRMRTNNIRVLLGDKVKVHMTPYDLTKCRIEFREKK